ncbi:MAG: aminotransferase class V-fold PLP-dependent enzyme [Bacteroidetes bacterium]|nr:aminotransferase class V-fold PLP-dependent enzyme [Bacteroidota bacterium]
MKLPIYMDHNATTPCDPRVVDAMIPYFTNKFGNAASRNHQFGWEGEEAVDYAREQVAKLINADSKEIIFTSGATEADNLAIKGVFEMYKEKGNHIITAKTEHKAVLDACKHVEKLGGEVTYLSVKEDGLIDLAELEAAMRPTTILVAIMYANNEIGVIQPVKEISAIAKKHGALFFTTLNVPGIVGFGKACEICINEMESDAKKIGKMRDHLESELLTLEESYLNGNKEHRLPHVANISFKYVEGEGLLMGVKDIALSSGSACTSASLEPSYVLKALGLDDELAHSSLRFGLGRFTTDEEIEYTINQVKEAVTKLREMSPLWEMFKEGIDLKTIDWQEH